VRREGGGGDHQSSPGSVQGPTQGRCRRQRHPVGTPSGVMRHRATGRRWLGHTKWNQTRCCVPKTHILDAICVGDIAWVVSYPDRVIASPPGGVPMPGLGQTALDSHDSGSAGTKDVHGFHTGDLTRANIPAGNYVGTHVGRVAVRSPEEIQHLHQHREGPRGRPPSLHRRLAIRKLGWSHQPEGVINAS